MNNLKLKQKISFKIKKVIKIKIPLLIFNEYKKIGKKITKIISSKKKIFFDFNNLSLVAFIRKL